ncbi:hypothetical protein Mapa_009405 [Marchantia paleacea]|nr:hypothetical protein Mapa_009405 [Marchantia paleacea]
MNVHLTHVVSREQLTLLSINIGNLFHNNPYSNFQTLFISSMSNREDKVHELIWIPTPSDPKR